jgi:superfamily II DNA or RNA helicase
VAFKQNDASQGRRVRLPPVWNLTKKEAALEYCQLASEEIESAATISILQAFSENASRISIALDGGKTVVAVKKPKGDLLENADFLLQSSTFTLNDNLVAFHPRASWLSHPQLKKVAEARLCDEVRKTWVTGILYPEERRSKEGKVESIGLRPPQIGALHAIAAHFTVSKAPSLVVMPTGTGKTEVMLATSIMRCPERLLVLVPSDALRTQTYKKFVRLGLLRKLGVIGAGVANPVVGVLRKSVQNKKDLQNIEKCNVIISTVAGLQHSSTELLKQFCGLFDTVFFDEAHHVPANSWQRIIDALNNHSVVQFTATPFRLDGQRIPGRIIYNFPLRLAQEQKYFRQINFCEVFEPDEEKSDAAIAEEAVRQLREDLTNNLDHFLLARVDSIARAQKLLTDIYGVKHKDLNPVVIHSRTSGYAKTLEDITAGKHRIIVCVDMFGEGFDFPRLKIAALHDPHRSLGITLQFTGRFTRDAAGIGDATLVANIADPKVAESIEELYAEDSDWNKLIPELSAKAIQSQMDFSDFLQNMESEKLGDEIFGLNVLRPKVSTVLFKAKSFSPRNFRKGLRKGLRVERVWNSKDKDLLIFVTKSRSPIEWASIKETTNELWDLYVVYFDKTSNLLFIYSSQKGTLHQPLAEAVTGKTAQLISGEQMFRAFSGVSRLVFHNAGLYGRGKKLRFRMYTGLDIGEAIDPANQIGSTKSNLFAVGYEGGERVSVGASHKGRVWSMRSASVPDWQHWCRSTAQKILNPQIATNEYLQHTLIPKEISQLPTTAHPYAITMPIEWYSPEAEAYRVYSSNKPIPFEGIGIADFSKISDTELEFVIESTTGAKHVFAAHWGPTEGAFAVSQKSGDTLELRTSTWTIGFAEFFQEHPPVLICFDGSEIIGPRLLSVPQAIPFEYDPARIMAFNWPGVDIKVESKWKNQTKRTNSIQGRMIDTICKQTNQIVFDDDDSGEAADIVEIVESGEDIVIRLYHCKFSSGNTPAQRVKDLYEVCGQAVRSMKWTTDTRRLLTHLQLRESLPNGRATRFEKGDLKLLASIKRRLRKRRVRFEISIVQPGLSKAALEPEVSSILGAASNYLTETTNYPLGVYASA